MTANELHVPISDPANPTPTYLTMSSADVSHSFWVPRLAGKMDLIPNRINVMWIDPPRQASTLDSAHSTAERSTPRCCCASMHSRLHDFAAWVEQQRKPAQQDFTGNSAAAEGQTVFMHNACINCHTIAGTVATGRFGPDLTHLATP